MSVKRCRIFQLLNVHYSTSTNLLLAPSCCWVASDSPCPTARIRQPRWLRRCRCLMERRSAANTPRSPHFTARRPPSLPRCEPLVCSLLCPAGRTPALPPPPPPRPAPCPAPCYPAGAPSAPAPAIGMDGPPLVPAANCTIRGLFSFVSSFRGRSHLALTSWLIPQPIAGSQRRGRRGCGQPAPALQLLERVTSRWDPPHRPRRRAPALHACLAADARGAQRRPLHTAPRCSRWRPRRLAKPREFKAGKAEATAMWELEVLRPKGRPRKWIYSRDKPEIDAFEMGRPRSVPRASKPPEIGVILG